jgi:hypothetical protein
LRNYSAIELFDSEKTMNSSSALTFEGHDHGKPDDGRREFHTSSSATSQEAELTQRRC